MRQDIEQTEANTATAPIPPFDTPFKRQINYQEFQVLNETQALALVEASRNHKIYWGGRIISATLLGLAIGSYFFDYADSTFHFMAGMTACSTVLTFTALRNRFKQKDKFLRLVIYLRFKNKLMREQDKLLLNDFAKLVHLDKEVVEIIQNGEYLPFSEEEMAQPLNPDNPLPQHFHEFSKKQHDHLLYSLLTAQNSLETFMLFGLGLLMSTAIVTDESSLLPFKILVLLVMGALSCFVFYSVNMQRKEAMVSCAEGTADEVLAKLKTAKPYSFFKVGEHLFHLGISVLCLPIFTFSNQEIALVPKTFIFVAALIMLTSTIFAMYRAIQSSNRYKAEQANKSK